MPGEPTHQVINLLVDAGYLTEIIDDDAQSYLPQHAIETIRLTDIISDIRKASESRVLSMSQLISVPAVDVVMDEIDAASKTALGDRTVKDLVESDGDLPEMNSGSRPG